MWRDDYEDARAEARAEAAADHFDAVAVTCAECGARWDPGVHRATRIDPAWCEQDECPCCGGRAFEWLSRDERRTLRDRLVAEYEEAQAVGDAQEAARVDGLLEAFD